MGVPQNGWFIIYGKSKSKMDDDWVYINMENHMFFSKENDLEVAGFPLKENPADDHLGV